MASIARIATQVRPRFIGVLLLTAIALIPWREHAHDHANAPYFCGTGAANSNKLPAFIDVPLTASIEVIKPPPLADAAEWPRGMVIHPPAIDGSILQWKHSPLDNLLSVFIAPFRALGA